MRIVGLMAGTSADGIDVAIVDVFGIPPQLSWQLLHHETIAYEPALRQQILACCRGGTVAEVCVLHGRLGEAFAAAALAGIHHAGLSPDGIDLIASHGQTVWHQPQDHATLQLGETAVIAERTGIPVIGNFRARDLAAGGQGAPLVAYADALLFRDPERVRAVQNIGGMANVTYLPAPDQPVIAFDTGPGNVLIDAAVEHLTQGSWTYDEGGALGGQGRVDWDWVAERLRDPYFRQPPPKSTGREYWRWERLGLPVSVDSVATVTALTAASIVQAYRDFLPRLPDQVIVSGGGSRNRTLMGHLETMLAPIPVVSSDAVGLPSAAKEAVSFALLAYESYHRRPGTLASATGARHPVILGHLTPAPPPPPLPPEASNPRSRDLDRLSTLALVELFNREDAQVAYAVAQVLPAIARAIDGISERLGRGGRLIYVGAGTSGRLGVLDAAECPPTFNTDPGQVIACIAGGSLALTQAIEGAEDDGQAAIQAMQDLRLSPVDSVVGISASGTTPYVLAALATARQQGSLTVALTCHAQAPLNRQVEIAISPEVGAEVISGSTRLKAGTAQKMVLNMISSGVMIRLGKTYGNLMVDVRAGNAKLRRRAQRLVSQICHLDPETAQALLDRCGGEVKTAILCHLRHWDPETARQQLQGRSLRQVLSSGEHKLG
ncbi:MAG: anhydro-N-acetylmuramic acid kinase [Thermostichales cyanobacterium SRBZ-1_bins_19]